MKALNLYNREYNKIKQSRFDIHELDVNTFCEKITGFKTKSEKEKMDALL